MTEFHIRIESDENVESPREWDNLGKMVCFHKRYNLGDKHEYKADDFVSWSTMKVAIRKGEDTVVILPLYVYDHGGITMSVTSFSCPWDSGQIGYIFARREDVLKEWGAKRVSEELRKKVEEILLGEVKTYDQFLMHEVYGYVIEDECGEHIESCWGLYGRDYCEKEAQEVVEHLKQREKEAAVELKRTFAAQPCCRP